MNLGVLVAATFLITLIGEILGGLGLYRTIFEYDSLMHFLGGLFAGSVGLLFWHYLNRLLKVDDRKSLKVLTISYATFFGFFVGALWEIAQSYNIISCYGPVSDTLMDLTMDILGGLLIGFWYTKEKWKIKKLSEPKPYNAILTIPNIITSIGICLLIPYIWSFLTDGNRWVMFGSIFFAGFSDLIDGFAARKLKQKTRIGAVIDTSRDKLLLFAILWHFFWIQGISAVWGWCGIILLLEASAVTVYFSFTPFQRAKTYCFRKIRAGHVFLFGAVLLSMYFRNVITLMLGFDFKFSFDLALPINAAISFATLVFYLLCKK
jgi:cardiolipin synthase